METTTDISKPAPKPTPKPTVSIRPINLNAFFATLFCGAAAGAAVGGVMARLSMRAVALLIGSSGSFSLEGTFGILLMGGIFGVIFGGLYAFLRHALPLRTVWKGALYGGLWAVLVCYFFFVNREGELGLVSPWVGALLFAPIPIVQGMGMAWLLEWVERRWGAAPVRTVPAHWFAGLLLAGLLALVGMGSLAGEGVRLPPLLFNTTTQMGVDFSAVIATHRFFGLLFMGGWVGLCMLLFGLGSGQRQGRLTALGFLLMAAGLFHSEPLFIRWMAGIPVGRWASAFLGGAGAGALIWLLLTQLRPLPDRWVFGISAAAAIAVLLWQGAGPSRLAAGEMGIEWVLWAVVLLVAGGSATLALVRGWRAGLTRSVAPAWALAVFSFLAIWAATLLFPVWNIRGNIHPFAPLGVTVYLLPWLLPLAATALAARRGLWAKE